MSGPVEDTTNSAIRALDYYQIIRHRLEQEDNLIVQRLSWMVASQSFLFTAYAITVNGLVSPTTSISGQQYCLYRLLPMVGILSGALIYCSILAAVRAMTALRRAFDDRYPGGLSELPPVQSAAATRRVGMTAPLVLPVMFIAAWVFLLTR